MCWRILLLIVVLTFGGLAHADTPPEENDPTVVKALRLLGLPRAEWPQVVLVAPGQFVDPTKDLETFAAFRIRRGGVVDPVIYLNPRHRFYVEARSCGADLYPLLRLASVIRHEIQHGMADHGEAAALGAQAEFLRRTVVLLPRRRQDALAYVQALEVNIPAARRWDATGRYPTVELR